MKKEFTIIFLCAIGTIRLSQSQIVYPGDSPGEARLTALQGNQAILENNVILLSFEQEGGNMSMVRFEDKVTHEQIKLTDIPLFELILQDNSVITSNECLLSKGPDISNWVENQNATTYAGKLNGKKFEADFINPKSGLHIHWQATLMDGSNYIRQIFTFTSGNPVNLAKISLIKFPANFSLIRQGTVDGSPLIHNTMFFALEHPMSEIEQNKAFSIVFLPRIEPITSESSFTASSVWGITPVNQIRRGFIYYLERERANPYHQLLHYNSWYDVSFADRSLNDSLCLNRIQVFRDSLIIKRHVHMDAFLFDDGWDDYSTLWQFNAGFPAGFENLKEACAASQAGLGVWMSPWGGYDIQKQLRLEYGKKQNPPFETNENGFTLSGPVYYNRFKEVAGNFIRKYNVSIFKFDGVGAGNGASGASITYQKDIDAFLRLINDLRTMKPDLFLSLTVGTWPSVYWLKYGDATWRAGDDTGLRGKGSRRQQWINYRDAETYQNVVKRAPLYPVSALMYCGICIADQGIPGTLEMNDKDISDEIWSFFGTGTNLQEMYINPHKLNSANWDCLAKAIHWAKENENIMADAHWVGGDPAKEEVYGYASWSPQKGILTLRNPSRQRKTFEVDVAHVFELPANIRPNYLFFDAKAVDKTQPVAKGNVFSISLEPFELKVLDAIPVQ
jgi:hypothetical protein